MATEVKKVISKKTKWIIGIVAVLVVLIVLVVLFGNPSANTVFKDMNDTMLQTKAVTINESYKGGTGADAIDLTSTAYMDMTSSSQLLSQGNFTLNLTASGVPMAIDANYTTIGSDSYIKFNKLSSSSTELSSSFSQVEAKLKGNWIKSRVGDSFTTFAQYPTEILSSVLPTPFANLNDTQRKDVLAILQDKSTYTINESSKVDVGGVSAYKYDVTYNKDQYNKVAKAIAGYVSYFKASSTDSSQIKSLTVWVNIKTKQIIKMEFTGSTSQGDITGTISFSGYNQSLVVEKPSNYSIESELLAD